MASFTLKSKTILVTAMATGIVLVAGLGWAALQAFATPLLQLPYAIGVGLTFLCCYN